MNRRQRPRNPSTAVITTYRNIDCSKVPISVSSIPVNVDTAVPTKSVTSSDVRVNHEPITFVWLDLRLQSTSIFIRSLRAINDFVGIYTDVSKCLEELKVSTDKIFLILPSNNEELIIKFHAIDNIEAMFVFHSEATPIEHEYPKLLGIFKQHEELTRSLKDVIDKVQQIHLEVFTFEQDNRFLWLQLWKEEVITIKCVLIDTCQQTGQPLGNDAKSSH